MLQTKLVNATAVGILSAILTLACQREKAEIGALAHDSQSIAKLNDFFEACGKGEVNRVQEMLLTDPRFADAKAPATLDTPLMRASELHRSSQRGVERAC
jgi:hypothetical protein